MEVGNKTQESEPGETEAEFFNSKDSDDVSSVDREWDADEEMENWRFRVQWL